MYVRRDLADVALKPRHPHIEAPTPINYSGGLMTLRFMLLPRSILGMLQVIMVCI
jgi:hypothetical protein